MRLDADSRRFGSAAKDQIVSFQFEHRTPEIVTIAAIIDMLEMVSRSSFFRHVNWKCFTLPNLYRVEHAFRRGGLSVLGLSQSQLLRARESTKRAALESTPNAGRAKSCILLYMLGGPPQQETFDMKPEAPGPLTGLFT
jgi:hypothetical protein